MKKLLSLLLVVILALGGVAVLMLVNPLPVKAATNYYVNDDSTAGDVWCSVVGSDANDGMSPATPKRTIQAIINTHDLGAGDTVYVDAGTYAEHVVIGGADSGLTLQGAGASLTSVNGSATGLCLYLLGVTQGTVSGFTFTNGGAVPHGGGMYIRASADITVSSCTFSGNTASYGGGMEIFISTNTTITSCTFSGNTASYGGGMGIMDCSPTITNCTFSGNSATSSGGGIYGDPLCASTITNCIFWGDSNGELSGPALYSVSYSDVQGGYGGTGNINTDPRFVNAPGGDFHLQSEKGHWTSTNWVLDAQTSPCIDAGNPLSACGNEPSPSGGRINMGAYGNTAQASKSLPATLIVTTNSDSGVDATYGASLAADTADGPGLSLREALNWAGAGDTVTFAGAMSGDTITLSGTQLTIDKDIALDGDLDDDSTPDITISGNNTSLVIYTTGLTAAARLEGLTITNGLDSQGSGMYNSGSSPTIVSCNFSNNIATGTPATDWGGGMYNDGTSSPTITSCTFDSNTADYGGGIFNDNGSSLTIANCTFSNNTVSQKGGGICNNVSSGTVTNCTFTGNNATNSGGGMYNTGSSPSVTGCTFDGNTSNVGGGMSNAGSSPTITNCAFSNNTASRYGGGMYNSESTPTITGCNFTANTADGGITDDAIGGGMYNYKSTLTITSCNFLDNTATATGAWISLGGAISNVDSSSNITNCSFSGNSAQVGGGMYNASSSSNITNCTFSGNTASMSGSGIYNIGNSSPIITNCILWGNTGGEIINDTGAPVPSPIVSYSDVQGGYAGTGNIDTDPLFVNAAGGDFHIQSQQGHWTSGGWVLDAQTSPCLDAGNPASTCGNEPAPNGGRINMGVYGNTAQASKSLPATLIVTTNSDSGDDATIGASLGTDEVDGSGLSIREALNWAGAGDTVTFDGGMSGDTITLSGTRLTVDKDITLDGDLDDDSTPDITISGNNTSQVIYTNGLTAAARLEGLTITNGSATNGGGMYNSESTFTITSCNFTANTADGGAINDALGGGMYNYKSTLTITSCTFLDNAATATGIWVSLGGGMSNIESSLTITDCTFSGNTAETGGGMYNAPSSPTITNCTFSNNTAVEFGGGIYDTDSSSPTITDCTFSGNSADAGGAICTVDDPVITNCIFTSNTATNDGGAIYMTSGPYVTNCTFTGNTAAGDGGAIFWYVFCGATIKNSIFWGDIGGEIIGPGNTGSTVTYSDVQGGKTGTGNINLDPLFVNAAGGDFHLLPASPCIDSGDNTAPGLPASPLIQIPRLQPWWAVAPAATLP